LKLQSLLIVLIFAILIQGWAACSVDGNATILQFNSRLALDQGTFSEQSSDQFIADSIIVPNLDQASVDNPLMGEISQDLKTIQQVLQATDDISPIIEDSKQDDLRQQLESGFNQILEIQINSNEQGEFSSYFAAYSTTSDDVNSNMDNLMAANGEGWDVSWGTNPNS
jgi:hypothetical protein